MSYCVNCGVELDASLKKCPLCGTTVYNPSETEVISEASDFAFPKRKGEVERVNRRDQVFFVSVLILTIIVTCGLLNGLVYNSVWWSVPVNGICVLLWIFYISVLIIEKITVYLAIAADAAAIAGYLYVISQLTQSKDWLIDIGIPILAALMLLLELFTLLSRKLPFSLLVGTLYFFIINAVICITIEICVDLHFSGSISLSWSAIVLTVCTIISVILLMALMMRRVRNSISRRLHF